MSHSSGGADRIPDTFVEELRARIPVSEIVRRRVHLTKAGREWKGLSPFNKERTPSFFVNDQKGFYHDFSSGKHGDIFGFVMETEGLKFPEAVEKIAALAGLMMPDVRQQTLLKAEPPIALSAPAAKLESDSDKYNQRLAGQICREMVPPIDTIAMVHFRRRNIDQVVVEIGCNDLGFHPNCPNGSECRPAIIELLRDIHTNQPQAIRRTFLTPDGVKIGKAKALGPKKNTACKLVPDDEVTLGLTIGEGLETVLSGMLLGFRPAWGLGDAGNLGGFPVIGGIECLTILVDHDESGTGQRRSVECSARWTGAGREVVRVTPIAAGSDINNVIEGAV
jgi:hypothetical protein